MDQIGAIAGPLFFTIIFTLNGDYRKGYAYLSIPFVLLMIILLTARMRIPDPSAIERTTESDNPPKNKLSSIFWLYTAFSAFSVLGFANFAVIAYHLKTTHSATDAAIPLLYALAMGIDAIAALFVGRLYDRIGLRTLIAIPVLTVPAVFLSFSRPFSFIVTGMALWGIVMAIHETVMRAAIADLTSLKKRGTGYGIFNTTYGFFIFAGSALMGILYEHGILYITFFTVAAEVCSAAVLFAVLKSNHSGHLRQSILQ
jgi:predicted MFS family arabinose efflux permease